MTKVFLNQKYFTVKVDFDCSDEKYASWNLHKDVVNWLNEYCKNKWTVTQKTSFDVTIYNDYMHDLIEIEMAKHYNQNFLPPKRTAIDHVYKKCSPYIEFECRQDATLCKLTW